MLHADRARAESFGEVAERYDRTRPSYPSELIDELLADAPRRVLDLGCGTGIAASLLKQRGCEVLGVEPDARMAGLARRKGIDVEVATFESWQPRGRHFGLITSAQAWHWIDPAVGLPKAAALLRGGGRLAVFWNIGSPPAELKAVFESIYARLAPGAERYSVLLGNATRRTHTIKSALGDMDGIFTDAQARSFTWTRRYRTAQWLDLLLTHSDHRALSLEHRDALLAAVGDAIEQAGGEFEMTYVTQLVSVRALEA